jgi:hypothetical protein
MTEVTLPFSPICLYSMQSRNFTDILARLPKIFTDVLLEKSGQILW